MFIRRNKKNASQKIIDWVWPSIGFSRAFKYIVHRLGRLSATPYQISCGFACGAAISFTPFIGIHFILSSILTYVMRGSIIASAIGTIVGNPLTFPFIWALTYETGARLLGLESNINVAHMFSEALSVFGQMNQWYFDLLTVPSVAFAKINEYTGAWAKIWEIIFPLLIGSVPWSVIVWLICFATLRPFFRAYRSASQERKNKRQVKK